MQITKIILSCNYISSVESQKGVIAHQRCSVENRKGAIAIDFVQQYRPSGSQREHLRTAITPFWLSTDDLYLRIFIVYSAVTNQAFAV